MPVKTSSDPEFEIQPVEGIRFLPGQTDVLVVALHGPYQPQKAGRCKYRNDLRTGLIAEAIHDETGWFTVINDSFIKPDKKMQDPAAKRLDLNKIDHAKQIPGFLANIKKAVDASTNKVLVIWIHGMSDDSASERTTEHIEAKARKKADGEIHALIGHGQGQHPRINQLKNPKAGDKVSCDSASVGTTKKVCEELTALGLHTATALENDGNFRGRDPKRMNQWFINQRYSFDKVESIQIEIREKDFRETPEQCAETASRLVKALKTIVAPLPVVVEQPPPSEPLITEVVDPEQERAFNAFEDIKTIFNRHFHNAMLDAGRLIVNQFYGGSFAKAMKKKPKHEGSLRQLIALIQENTRDAPSKTWVYDAVNLAVDAHRLSGFRTYGKIGHSHKVLLTHVSDLRVKKQLIKETAREGYSVARLRERIKEVSPIPGGYVGVDNVPPDEDLEKLSRGKLDGLMAKLEQRIADHKSALAKYEGDKGRVEKAINKAPGVPGSKEDETA